MARKSLAGVLLVILILSCSSMRVMVNYDETVDFGQYRTFAFERARNQARGQGRTVQNPLFTQDVMRQIRPILENKGYREAGQRQNADLLVVFYAAVQNRRDFVPPTYRVGRWGRVWRTSPGRTVRWKEGTLVIDMVDRDKKALVWQGVGKGMLDRSNPGRNLVESAAKILEKFPPQ
jgi:hypothetical protein